MIVEQSILFAELGFPEGPDRWVGSDRQLGWTAGWSCGCSAFTYELQLEAASAWNLYPCPEHNRPLRDFALTQYDVPAVVFRTPATVTDESDLSDDADNLVDRSEATTTALLAVS